MKSVARAIEPKEGALEPGRKIEWKRVSPVIVHNTQNLTKAENPAPQPVRKINWQRVSPEAVQNLQKLTNATGPDNVAPQQVRKINWSWQNCLGYMRSTGKGLLLKLYKISRTKQR